MQRRTQSEEELKKTIEQLREEEAEVLARKNALFKAQEDYNDLRFALQKAQEHTVNLENAIKVNAQSTIKNTAAVDGPLVQMSSGKARECNGKINQGTAERIKEMRKEGTIHTPKRNEKYFGRDINIHRQTAVKG
ncbi:hypothetical protein EPH_0073170 [Eimeria praecox]|uniref:Uncharacterized protein n=1 Tax=Eimeria praecox TaxID=51316 RepID=U6H701_9EIME|nr:hypothetical protein EPH_0073170 [Eimeria praecox]